MNASQYLLESSYHARAFDKERKPKSNTDNE